MILSDSAPTILQSRRLGSVIRSITVTLVLCDLISLTSGLTPTTYILSATCLLMLVASRIQRRGNPALAAHIVLAILTISICGLIVLNQGMRDPGMLALPGLVVFASMFVSRRAYLMTVGFLFVVLTALVFGDVNGWYVTPVTDLSPRILGYTLAILGVTAFFIWLISNDLRGALNQLVQENEKIRESNIKIERLARHDSLTGLLNRSAMRERFEQALEHASRSNTRIALLYFDLDDFKAINDSLGHATGDQLLCQIARRLERTVQADDLISRHGGDEFLLVLTNVVDLSAVTNMATKVIDCLGSPFYVDGVELSTTCSIGITVYPQDGTDFPSLLRGADMAMFKAKDSGRNAFRFYDGSMNSSVVEHLHLVAGIRSALARNEFILYFQPKFELKTRRIVGVEALLRWIHPELGYIPPNKFISVAERSGLIHDLGKYVIDAACRQTKEWQNLGLGDLVTAINISPVQFRRDSIERSVVNALAMVNLEPHCIELELTESLLMADSQSTKEMLVRLRELGLGLSIDDFGTGYSNLGYLKNFEVQCLKIDQSFVRRMTVNENDAGIVRAIIEMAHSLGLVVVAEGIEDQHTLDRLIELGCEYGQGFYWSPALPAHEFLLYYHANQVSAEV